METIDFNQVIQENISVVEELLPEVTQSKKGLVGKKEHDRLVNLSSTTYNMGGVFIIDTGLLNTTDQYASMDVLCINTYSETFLFTLSIRYTSGGKNIILKKHNDYPLGLKLFVYNNKIHLYIEVYESYGFFSIGVKHSYNGTLMKMTDLKEIPEEATNITVAA